MEGAEGSCPSFLDRLVEFPDGTSYELLDPLTNLRSCQDGTPAEARILFTCRQAGQASEDHGKNEFVMKIKVQLPDEAPQPGPSTTTTAELKALQIFKDSNAPCAPRLVNWKRLTQGQNGPHPGGYLTFTVMTKMPGQTLFDLKYAGIPPEEQEEIRRQFLLALRSIYSLGIEPIDRALRNVLWERQTKRCIIDFELWRETKETISDETSELQRWGLTRRPPSTDWWAEWNAHAR